MRGHRLKATFSRSLGGRERVVEAVCDVCERQRVANRRSASSLRLHGDEDEDERECPLAPPPLASCLHGDVRSERHARLRHAFQSLGAKYQFQPVQQCGAWGKKSSQ